jgi:hypothetical protein
MSKPIHNERNAGRKPMYNEPSTKSKSYTIPASKMQDFDEYAKRKIKEYMGHKGHTLNVTE